MKVIVILIVDVELVVWFGGKRQDVTETSQVTADKCGDVPIGPVRVVVGELMNVVIGGPHIEDVLQVADREAADSVRAGGRAAGEGGKVFIAPGGVVEKKLV